MLEEAGFRVMRLVVIVSIALIWSAGIAPQPVDSGILGQDWRCSRTAGLLTTCEKAVQSVHDVREPKQDSGNRQVRHVDGAQRA